MNKNKLKSIIIAHGKRVEDFVDEVDKSIDRDFTKDVYYSRISGKTEFKRDEIAAIKTVLQLDDTAVMDIFFNQ